MAPARAVRPLVGHLARGRVTVRRGNLAGVPMSGVQVSSQRYLVLRATTPF